MVLRPRCDRNWAGQISSKRRTVVERQYHIVHMKGAMNSARYVAKTVKVLMPTVESPGFWDSCRRCGFRSTLLRSRCHAWGTAPGRAGRRLQESATVQAYAVAMVNRAVVDCGLFPWTRTHGQKGADCSYSFSSLSFPIGHGASRRLLFAAKESPPRAGVRLARGRKRAREAHGLEAEAFAQAVGGLEHP